MTQTKHTPAPWEIRSAYHIKGGNEYEITAGNKVIIKIGQKINEYDNVEANARLIASAPELLEALKHIISRDGDERINQVKNELFRLAPELKPMIESAIHKAEGHS